MTWAQDLRAGLALHKTAVRLAIGAFGLNHSVSPIPMGPVRIIDDDGWRKACKGLREEPKGQWLTSVSSPRVYHSAGTAVLFHYLIFQ